VQKFYFAEFFTFYIRFIKITAKANTFERKNFIVIFHNKKLILKCTWYFSEETFYVSNIQNVSKKPNYKS